MKILLKVGIILLRHDALSPAAKMIHSAGTSAFHYWIQILIRDFILVFILKAIQIIHGTPHR